MRRAFTGFRILLEADQEIGPGGRRHREEIVGVVESAVRETQHRASSAAAILNSMRVSAQVGIAAETTFQTMRPAGSSSSISTLVMRWPLAKRISPLP